MLPEKDGLPDALTEPLRVIDAVELTVGLTEPLDVTVAVALTVAVGDGIAQAPAGRLRSSGPTIE